MRVEPAAALLGSTAVATWPVWLWYAERLGDSPDDALAVAAVVLLVVLSLRAPRAVDPAARWSGSGHPPLRLLTPSLLALLAYAIGLPLVPRLASATLGFLALGFTWSLWRYGTPLRPWAVGLALLGLPMAQSLQFYCGYPLRVASGVLAQLLLRLGGVPVVREGVYLRWGEELVMIDAPCSGVRMLWTALLLGCCLSALLRLPPRASLLAAVAAASLALLGNGLRTAALFWMDTMPLELPALAHEGVGISAFVLMAVALLAIVRLLSAQSRREDHPCALSAST